MQFICSIVHGHLENDANQEPIHRSSSGETSGPDDDQTIEVLEEEKIEDKPVATEVHQKAIESAKYFGSNLTIDQLIDNMN